MLLRRFLTKNRKADADQTSMGNDRTSPYTSNVTTIPTHNLSGRDSETPPEPLRLIPSTYYTSNVTTAPSHTLAGRDYVRQPDESESTLADTSGVAEKSNVATANYSKRPSVSPPGNSHSIVSILSYLR